MYSFKNDYDQIAHPTILENLNKHANIHFNGYGLDDECIEASRLIKKHIKKDVDIHYLIGGTSANKIVISHILKPYEAVISVNTGHINVHETGAIESSGHKIILSNGKDGKILPEEIINIYNSHVNEHMVKPKMVYISNATELGTIYTLAELKQLYHLTRELNMYLFIDGARLGTALTAKDNDLTLDNIANLCDVFYIGGTKNGAMLGEALVISNDNFKSNFRYSIKQNGGMLAKGFLIGIQFISLFTNNLFFDLAKHANKQAEKIRNKLNDLNLNIVSNSKTNIILIELDKDIVNKLAKKYIFEIWESKPSTQVIRLVTSWATKDEAVLNFLDDLEMYTK